ncbi:MAG: hypothetical protein M3R55_04135 [Acidobacteriota bacterium]|nr:hypothetical protein [Acidobacteriota bacterium]
MLAVVMTWPIAPKMNRAARIDSTDAMYAMWNVAWVARAVTSNPAELFNANIFHPHKGTLAYSEGNIGAGVLGAPAWALTRNPYTTYNSVVLLGFTLSFLCTYALVHRLTGRRLPALVAAAAFAYMPYVYARLPHIQLQMTFGIPWHCWRSIVWSTCLNGATARCSALHWQLQHCPPHTTACWSGSQ